VRLSSVLVREWGWKITIIGVTGMFHAFKKHYRSPTIARTGCVLCFLCTFAWRYVDLRVDSEVHFPLRSDWSWKQAVND
jgi:hypothetical protein